MLSGMPIKYLDWREIVHSLWNAVTTDSGRTTKSFYTNRKSIDGKQVSPLNT